MQDGTIYGNTSGLDGGGGVCVFGDFTMNGGTISGNTASRGLYGGYGGGVKVDGGFTMNGGTISGNTSGMNGGGVYVNYDGRFAKTGGTISGNDATEADRNTANQQGYVVYNATNKNWRNATAGPKMNTDTYGFWLND